MKTENKEQKLLEGNLNKVCVMNFLDGMWFATPVFVLFLLQNNMSLTQIGIILGAYPVMQLLFDIPSSVWADKYSRKFMLILSVIGFTFQNVAYFFSHSFELFLIGSCFNGIGEALWTGTFSALIYDSLLSLGKEEQYEKVQSRVMKSFFAGRFLVCIFGVYIFLINPRAVFLLSLFFNIINIIAACSLKEPPREKSISQSFDQIKEGFTFLLKNKTIWNTIIIFAIMGSSFELLFNYYQPILNLSKVPVAYFGIIYVLASLLSFWGAGLYMKVKPKVDWKDMMVAYLLIDLTASLLFGTQMAALVLFAIIFLSISSGSQNIYINSIIHRVVPSSHRATAISINGLVYMLFSMVLLNVISFSMDHSSIFVGMLVNAIIILIAILAFLKTDYKKSAPALLQE